MPDGNPTGDQGKVSQETQPSPDLFFISPAAHRYMSMRAEAGAGAPPAAAQGEGDGQGQGQEGNGAQSKGGGGGFNWDLFPDVPEAQRPLLEPHLKNVQGHVTKLEQSYSPFKALIDSGADPQAIQNLLSFDQQFTQDPVGTWMMLAANMQKEGTLSDELDLDAVKAILNGEDPPGGEGAGSDAGGQQAEGEIPAWAQELQQEIAGFKQASETQQQEQAAQQRQQQLEGAMGEMRTQLTEAGYDGDLLTDEFLTGAIISHKGDAEKAVAQLVSLREGLLKGLTQKGSGSKPEDGPNMPNGAPQTPKGGPRRSNAFSEANRGAEQMLRAKAQAEAQN